MDTADRDDLFADLVHPRTAPLRQPAEHRPARPAPASPTQYRAVPATAPRSSAGRRLLGIVALLVLTAVALPVHVLAVFFVYIELESPGDPTTSGLLVLAAAAASFFALLVTGTIAQAVGGFPGRWRARVTFAACSAVLALGSAYAAALTFF